MYSENEVSEMQAELAPAPESDVTPTEDGDAVETAAEGETSPESAEPTAVEDEALAATPVPSTWRKAAAEQWATLPDAIRDEVLKREQDMHNGLQMYAEKAQVADRFSQAISHIAPVYAEHNADPLAIIPSLLETHARLTLGSEADRVNILYSLADQYGIELGQAASRPQGREAELQQRIDHLEHFVQSQQQQQEQSRLESANMEAESFLADPANTYAADVIDQMVDLLQTRQATTLRDAYNTAIYLNPAVRQRVIAAEAAKVAQQQQNAARTAQQRVASRPFRSSIASATSQSSGNLNEDLGSLYDSLNNPARG